MAVIGLEIPSGALVLTKNRDFKWQLQQLDENGVPVDYPSGDLYIEFADGTRWEFDIVDAVASIKVESENVNKIARRTRWQLVFLPGGELAGGDPVARGVVRIQE